MTKKNEKAMKHIAKGDEYTAKGKFKKALAEYRKALEHDPDHEGLLDKLIRALDEKPGDWEMGDFAESVGWTMKKQELDHPPIKQVHAKLTPEWKQACNLALRIIETDDTAKEAALIEELMSMGEIASRALIGILLDIKKTKRNEPV